jgi:hypothetical protein
VAGINKLELVDGQQRLTTISVLLECIHDRLVRENELAEAQDVQRLLQARALGGAPVRKIALDSLDAVEFEKLADEEKLEHPNNPHLAHTFSLFRQWVKEQRLSELGTFLYRLKNQAIIIRLDVSEAKDAFKLFETINNRGLRLSPTDIIKNFILGNAARFGPNELELARQKWAELLYCLDGTSIDGFLRQFLIARMKKRVTASYVIQYFKALFMREVREAAFLPERHWYTDEKDIIDEEDEGDDSVTELTAEISLSDQAVTFNDFMADFVKCAKVYGQLSLRGLAFRKSIGDCKIFE